MNASSNKYNDILKFMARSAMWAFAFQNKAVANHTRLCHSNLCIKNIDVKKATSNVSYFPQDHYYNHTPGKISRF